MRKHYLSVQFLLLVLFSTALFANGANEELDSRAEITVVLDWVVNTNHTGLYIAKDLGYFEAEGLDVSIEFPPETGAAGLLLAGKADFIVSTQEGLTYARAAGKPMKAIAAIIQHNTSGFASPVDRGISSPEDFAGKTYGGWGSPIEDAILTALMGMSGNSLDEVNSIAIGSMDFFAATSGEIDFTWIFEGWDGVAAGMKGIPINFIRLSEIDPALDFYTPVLAAEDSFIQENSELVRAFLRAVTKGYRYAIENPEGAATILTDNAPELELELILASQQYLAAEYQADAQRWGEMRLAVWSDFAGWMNERGLLEGEFIPAEAFTNEYLP